MLFAELADDALAYSKARKRTYASDLSRMSRIKRWFASRAAESIAPKEIDEHLCETGQNEGLSPATLNLHHNLISLAYRLGMENGKVKSNPARFVRRRRETNGRLRFLSPQEERRLRVVVERDYPEHMPELDVGLNCGLRRGEQFGLEWLDVDFARRLVAVRESKTGEPRFVELNYPTLAAFPALRRRGNGEGRVFPTQKPRHWFEPAVRKARIEGFTWHSLRHTFASRLVMAGVDLRTVQELMGHKTVQMTARYAHLAPTHKLAAVERLESYAVKHTRRRGKAHTARPTNTKTSTSNSKRIAKRKADAE